jgi:hypothetical protein
MRFFEEKENRINLSERIELVNNARDKAVNEFAENLRKRAKPNYAINNCFCVDVAEISALEMQMLIDID